MRRLGLTIAGAVLALPALAACDTHHSGGHHVHSHTAVHVHVHVHHVAKPARRK